MMEMSSFLFKMFMIVDMFRLVWWLTYVSLIQQTQRTMSVFTWQIYTYREVPGITTPTVSRNPGQSHGHISYCLYAGLGSWIVLSLLLLMSYLVCIIPWMYWKTCHSKTLIVLLKLQLQLHSLLGGLRVTNPTIRLMISVCPSIRQ